MLNFRFREDKIGNEIILRPFVSLKLIGAGGEVEIFALVDSGADRTIIPAEIADFLRLRIGNHIETRGLGGSVGGFESSLTMKLVDSKGNSEVITEVPVYVMDEFEDIILGRKKIFDLFRVVFEQFNNSIRFEKE